jgi:hypothetical protein
LDFFFFHHVVVVVIVGLPRERERGHWWKRKNKVGHYRTDTGRLSGAADRVIALKFHPGACACVGILLAAVNTFPFIFFF